MTFKIFFKEAQDSYAKELYNSESNFAWNMPTKNPGMDQGLKRWMKTFEKNARPQVTTIKM